MAHNLKSDSLDPKPEEKSEFREITNASPDGVVVVNSAGQILFANPAAASMFGAFSRRTEGNGIRLSRNGVRPHRVDDRIASG